jgi:hypothetical protein
MLDASTIDKINILGSDYMTELSKEVPLTSIPKELGGTYDKVRKGRRRGRGRGRGSMRGVLLYFSLVVISFLSSAHFTPLSSLPPT